MTKKTTVPPQPEGFVSMPLAGGAPPKAKAAFSAAALKAGPFAGARPGPAKGKKILLPGKLRGR